MAMIYHLRDTDLLGKRPGPSINVVGRDELVVDDGVQRV
jgi:hypothetical protein